MVSFKNQLKTRSYKEFYKISCVFMFAFCFRGVTEKKNVLLPLKEEGIPQVNLRCAAAFKFRITLMLPKNRTIPELKQYTRLLHLIVNEMCLSFANVSILFFVTFYATYQL